MLPKACTEDNQEEEKEHIEERIGRDHIQDINPKDRCQQQAEAGVDEDDEEPVDEGVADAFASVLDCFVKKLTVMGIMGKRRALTTQQSREASPKEDASQPFFFSAVSSFCNRSFILAVVAESLQRWAVIWSVSRCLAVGKQPRSPDLGEDALLLIACHERDGAGDDLGAGVGPVNDCTK